MVPNLFSVMDPFEDLAASCGPLNKTSYNPVQGTWLNRQKAVFNLILSLLRINVSRSGVGN